MFNFLFRRGKIEAVKSETQREAFERALGEINGILAELDPKPTLTFDPVSGEISLALPEQMPDEALALPAPEEEAAQDPEAADEAGRAESAKPDAA